MANALTAVRLALVLPFAAALARPELLAPEVVALLLGLAIASDYLDGPLARRTGTASARGMLFDHSTDCLFVTGGLAGAAIAGAVTPILPALIPLAFGQYVVDSYVWHRQRQLRASFLGRWNGILYFVPLVLIAAARLPFPAGFASFLRMAAGVLGYLLVASTVASIIDRATTPVQISECQSSGRTRSAWMLNYKRPCIRNRIEPRAARAAGRASGCAHGSSGCPGSPVSADRRTYCRCSRD